LSTCEGKTSLAVVTVDADGDRDFLLYREGCAESTYAPEEIAADIIADSRILHVGSLLLGEPVCAAAQRRAVRLAREAGVAVSVDVNLRPSAWRSVDAMRVVALEAAEDADILKVSEEELTLMAQTGDLQGALGRLERRGRRLTAVTFGQDGALLAARGLRARIPGFAVQVADTVACGDAFTASLLADLGGGHADLQSQEGLAWLGRRACAAGALAAKTAGAMDSLPTAADRDAFLARRAER
jgi:sugar/nucleoside kinase (ribokinase family)